MRKISGGMPPTDHPAPSDLQLQQAIADTVARSLRSVAGGLALIYLVLAIAHALVLPPDLVWPLFGFAAASALLLWLFRRVLTRHTLSPAMIYPVGLVLAGMVLFNSLLHLYLSREPWQSTNLMLLVVGASFFLLSRRWLVIFETTVLIAWVGAVIVLDPSPLWLHYGFALFMSLILAGMIHVVHVGNLRRLEWLRLDNERHSAMLHHQAAHDALTGLVNRREFERRLERAVAGTRRGDGRHVLCYLDLDQFKLVNDNAGHQAGDALLKQLSQELLSRVRSRDTLARLGGDEFSLLLEHCSPARGEAIAEELVSLLRDFRFSWEGQLFNIGVSIGVTAITETVESATQVMAQADVACYTAKDLGRNRVHVYQPNAAGLSERHGQMRRASQIREALTAGRFCLFAQPIVALTAADPAIHYELLVRMLNDQGRIIPPGAFLPAAERFGLIKELDQWVIRLALEQLGPLLARRPGAQFNINLSAGSLQDEGLHQRVGELFADSGVGPERICFEITETESIGNLDLAARSTRRLRDMGCRIALDDFGKGMTSFYSLKRLPVDYLKIDGGFVTSMLDDPVDRAMVAAIVEIGRTMGLETIAEHVNLRTLEALRDLGVGYAQGFELGEPRPLAELLTEP